MIAFATFAPLVPFSGPIATPLSFVLSFACVSAEVLVLGSLAPAFSWRALWLLLPIAALLGAVAWAGDALPLWAAAALVTAALLAAGTLTGSAVGRAVEEAGHLLVVATVSALVDIFSVLHPAGPTAHIVQIPRVARVLVLPWPFLGTDRIEPILGVGDVTFATLYLVAARRHGLSPRRTRAALVAGLAATLGVVLLTGTGVPALPFLGVAVVLAHPEARRLRERDRRPAAVGLALLLLAVVVLFLLR